MQWLKKLALKKKNAFGFLGKCFTIFGFSVFHFGASSDVTEQVVLIESSHLAEKDEPQDRRLLLALWLLVNRLHQQALCLLELQQLRLFLVDPEKQFNPKFN